MILVYNAGLFFYCGVFVNLPFYFLDGLQSVSYTHLDVYKRQCAYSVIQIYTYIQIRLIPVPEIFNKYEVQSIPQVDNILTFPILRMI